LSKRKKKNIVRGRSTVHKKKKEKRGGGSLNTVTQEKKKGAQARIHRKVVEENEKRVGKPLKLLKKRGEGRENGNRVFLWKKERSSVAGIGGGRGTKGKRKTVWGGGWRQTRNVCGEKKKEKEPIEKKGKRGLGKKGRF